MEKSRLANEKFLIQKARQSDFKIIIVRISNVVGDHFILINNA